MQDKTNLRPRARFGLGFRQGGSGSRSWCGCCGDPQERRLSRNPNLRRAWDRKRFRAGGKSNIRRMA